MLESYLEYSSFSTMCEVSRRLALLKNSLLNNMVKTSKVLLVAVLYHVAVLHHGLKRSRSYALDRIEEYDLIVEDRNTLLQKI